ncbi:ACT domain-containing protein ACR12 isoform X2 [Trifolium pratense]|uniref:ACT domain-containing protein ACR12 isoform X2 n=1 Tax=Trifolium pratense TaxID=57577 RepID=UPI0008425ABE|nr:ACT domain-containing protein ACR12 isoform X2 [Trifolium pratense]
MAFTNAFLVPSFSLHTTNFSDPFSILPPSFSFHFRSSSSSSSSRTNNNNKNIIYASSYDLNAVDSASPISSKNLDSVPMPIVLIDQDSDSEATIVQLSFGDRLGALLDTMKALKDLGLDVSKGTVSTEGPVKLTKFFITESDTGRKVEDPDMLERIRLTIINNLLQYHPESGEQLALGEVFGLKAPNKKLGIEIATHIQVKEDGPKRSLLYIETADRPGLLVEIIKVIADVNIDVESAEIDTEGLIAKDTFHVSYGGAALNRSMSQVLVNCLRYYLRMPETDIDSY